MQNSRAKGYGEITAVGLRSDGADQTGGDEKHRRDRRRAPTVAPWPDMGRAYGIQSSDHGIANQGHREIEEIKENSPKEFLSARIGLRWRVAQ